MKDEIKELASRAARKSDEYYKLLAAKRAQTDWKNLQSVKQYNEYAKQLRKEMFDI